MSITRSSKWRSEPLPAPHSWSLVWHSQQMLERFTRNLNLRDFFLAGSIGS
jgi:hypothetical protein